MKDLLAHLERWRCAGRRVALAGSGPRGVGGDLQAMNRLCSYGQRLDHLAASR